MEQSKDSLENVVEKTVRIRLSETNQDELITQAKKRAQDRVLSALLTVASDESLAELFKYCDEVHFGDCSELFEMKAARDRALADPNMQTLGALSLSASAFAHCAWRRIFKWMTHKHEDGCDRYRQACIWVRDAGKNRSHLHSLKLSEQHEYWSSFVILRLVPDIDADLRRTSLSLKYSFEALATALGSVEAAPALIPSLMSLCRSAASAAQKAGLRFQDMTELALADSGRSVSNLEHAAELAVAKRRPRSGLFTTDDDSTGSTTRSGGGHSIQSDVTGDKDTNAQTSFGTDLNSDFTSSVGWDDSFDVNPSTGLPMFDGGVLDVGGHVFGTGSPGDGW